MEAQTLMGWLKEILTENRRTVASWPEWKRRVGMSEIDGMAAVNQGVVDQKFPHCMDAMAWAEEYLKTFPNADKMTMVGWFANAIMAGYDTAGMRCSGEIQRLQAENAQLKAELAQATQRETRLRETMQFYARRDSWMSLGETGPMCVLVAVGKSHESDGWSEAELALEEAGT